MIDGNKRKKSFIMQIEYEIEVVLSPWSSITIDTIPSQYIAKKMAIEKIFEEYNAVIMVWKHHVDDINRLNDQLIVTFKKLWP